VYVKLVEFAIMVYAHAKVQVTVSSSETGVEKIAMFVVQL